MSGRFTLTQAKEIYRPSPPYHLACRILEVNETFSQLSTSDARTLFEEEVRDLMKYLAAIHYRILMCCTTGQVAAIRRRDQEEIVAAAKARGTPSD